MEANVDMKFIEEEMKKVANETDPRKKFAKFMQNIASSSNPTYEKIMSQIKVSCPVKKINFSLEEDPDVIAGCWMMIDKDSVEKIKAKADLSNLNDGTFLFFANQHIVELSGILYGMLSLLKTSGALTQETILNDIRKYMLFLKDIPTYSTYKEFIDSSTICDKFELKVDYNLSKMYQKMSDILLYIPFITYTDIDEFAQLAIENFKKNLESKMGENLSNDPTGTTDNANT